MSTAPHPATAAATTRGARLGAGAAAAAAIAAGGGARAGGRSTLTRRILSCSAPTSGELTFGHTRLSLRSTAQPRYTRLPIICSGCFSKVATVGFDPELTSQPMPEVMESPTTATVLRRRLAECWALGADE